MRIVFVGPFALSPKSTVAVRALPMARELARRGHQVTVLIPPWDNLADGGREWEEDGVRVVNLALPGRLGQKPQPDGAAGDRPHPLPQGRRELAQAWYPWLAMRLLRMTLERGPDLVHAFKPKGFSGAVAQALLARRAVSGRGPAVVVDTDDWEGPGGWNERAGYPWWQRACFGYQERWLLRHGDGVTAASQTLVELAEGLRGRAAGVTYVPNGGGSRTVGHESTGAHPLPQGRGDQLAEHDRGPVLLLYTRFVECPPARVLALLEAVRKAGVAPTLLLVGRGMHGEEGELLEGLRAKGIPAVNAGWVDAGELPGYFRRADAAIFPMEDTLINRAKCSAKLVDLLGAGVPVVAEAVGQCLEYIVDGESGVLVPPGDFPAFGEAVARVLRDGRLRQRLGAGARARIAAVFGWQQLVDRVEEGYARAVRAAAARRPLAAS